MNTTTLILFISICFSFNAPIATDSIEKYDNSFAEYIEYDLQNTNGSVHLFFQDRIPVRFDYAGCMRRNGQPICDRQKSEYEALRKKWVLERS